MSNYLWLVASNSSSVKGTPSSRAFFNRGKCHFPGTPRWFHIETVDCPMPSSSPNRDGPPKRATSSGILTFGLDITPPHITCFDTMQDKNIDIAKGRELSQNVVMFPKQNRIDEKRDIKSAVMARVENVRGDTGETMTDYAARMGVDYKDYKGWVDRESIEMPYLIKLAQSLDLSLDYLCCIIDEPHPPSRQPVTRDYWSLRAESEKRQHQEKDETA